MNRRRAAGSGICLALLIHSGGPAAEIEVLAAPDHAATDIQDLTALRLRACGEPPCLLPALTLYTRTRARMDYAGGHALSHLGYLSFTYRPLIGATLSLGLPGKGDPLPGAGPHVLWSYGRGLVFAYLGFHTRPDVHSTFYLSFRHRQAMAGMGSLEILSESHASIDGRGPQRGIQRIRLGFGPGPWRIGPGAEFQARFREEAPDPIFGLFLRFSP